MRDLTLGCSAFCSCVAFGSPCLPFRAFAGVAVHSIPVATTVQHVRIRESLAVEGLQSKVLSPECAKTCNVFVRDLDVGVPIAGDGRRLEVVTDGLPLFHGAQLALDATMVSALRCDGTPHRRAAEEDGVVLRAVRRRKERTYPELTGRFGRARLVVLACEVGGRWSEETNNFLLQLAKAKVRGVPQPLKSSAKQSWLWRWRSILACAAAKAFAQELMGQFLHSEVMSDSRH